jgi:hypothetical protein
MYVPLPACDARSVHVPEAISEAVVPDTVHTVVVSEVSVIASPELAVADRVICDNGYSVAVIAAKVIV